ncbi:MAG TPA: diguanylate cyclase [Caulobacteraceae bacterium]|nr:diguanylate cyclase [Caulobacteraceae bacterium]
MATDARILIVTRDDFLSGPLAEGMGKLGWPAIAARGATAAIAAVRDRRIEGAIIDLAGGDEFVALGERLKEACAPRRLPVIAVGDAPGPIAGIDLHLAAPIHPAQAVLRMESLVRMAVAEEEFELRRETFAERGRELELPAAPNSPLRILAIGEPAPQFLALSNALGRNGVEVVGAFTAYTAFDYLHEKPFDGVVLWAGDNESEAMSIAAGMRRNTRLYHVPTMLYLGDAAKVTMGEAYHRGVSDIASPQTPEVETASRVVELARMYRRQSSIRQALEKARSSGLMDAATGLFTRDLFAVHLARLAEAATVRNRPLSVCVLRVSDSPAIATARKGGWLDRAVPQIGSMIGRLVRAEDTAARLGPEVFALALPSTPLSGARSAASRIAAVIGCTAFDAGDGKAPFVVDFDIGVAELEPGESAGRAIERAGSRALQRQAS